MAIKPTATSLYLQQKVREALAQSMSSSMQSVFDLKARVKRDFNIVLESNQIEIIEALLDPENKNLAVIAARSGGKTFGVIAGLSLLSIDGYKGKPVSIGITAPRDDQAGRVVSTFRSKVMATSSFLKDKIDQRLSTNSRIVWKNGSSWESFSGNEVSNQEGRHYDCFPGNTPILLANGTVKNIENINVGDLVLTCDLETLDILVEPVIAKHSRIDTKLQEITYIINSLIQEVKCTPDHKILTIRGFVKAVDIKCNDSVYGMTEHGVINGVVLSNKSLSVSEIKVYDLTIEKYPHYFANNLLVHNCLYVDEAQNVTDFAMSNMLLPMIGHSALGKVFKTGVPKFRGHFFKSFNSPNSVSLSYDWLHCPNLFNAGTQVIDGVSYPVSVLEKLPYPMKVKYFPNNPEMWTESANAVSDEDFKTQYEMQWLSNIRNLLNEDDQQKFFGTYVPTLKPETDTYFFGLDLAGGQYIRPQGCFTALSIGRIRDGQKQIIFKAEFQGNVVDQLSELLSIVHPSYGLYRCKYGLGDYGEMGPAVIDLLIREGVPMKHVMFGSRDSVTGKNMKNAMMDHVLLELRAGRFQYPDARFVQSNKLYKKHADQWFEMERKETTGINCFLETPSGIYSDGIWADVMAVYGIDKELVEPNAAHTDVFKNGTGKTFPSILRGTPIVRQQTM